MTTKDFTIVPLPPDSQSTLWRFLQSAAPGEFRNPVAL
jgi:hypothetical protein